MEKNAFSHCDKNEDHLSLHDCISERAYFSDGVLGFCFRSGFWIAPSHPSSNLTQTVRTNTALVEYALERGEECDVTVYVFKKNIFGQTVRTELPIKKMINSVNSGVFTVEFLYRYTDSNASVISCALRYPKKPYYRECVMIINGSSADYYWDFLRDDRPW